MKRKKIFLILSIVFMIINIISVNFQESHATLDGIIDGMKTVTNASAQDVKKAQDVINTVIGLLQVAGTGIALVVITLLGIKYMMASAGEKGEIKKHIVPIVIGCIILFLAVNIMAIVADFGETLN